MPFCQNTCVTYQTFSKVSKKQFLNAASYPHLLFIFQLNNFVTHPLAIPKMLPSFPQPQTVN